MRVISVFSPPNVGGETHDDDGAYPPSGDLPARKGTMFVKTLEDVRAAGMEVVVGRWAGHLTTLSDRGRRARLLLFIRYWLQEGVGGDIWYKNHWEGNLVLDGNMEVKDYATDEVHELGPGSLYLVGPKDRPSRQSA